MQSHHFLTPNSNISTLGHISPNISATVAPCRGRVVYEWRQMERNSPWAGLGWAGQGTRAGGGNNGMSVDRSLELGNPQLSIAGSRDRHHNLPPFPRLTAAQYNTTHSATSDKMWAKQNKAAMLWRRAATRHGTPFRSGL